MTIVTASNSIVWTMYVLLERRKLLRRELYLLDCHRICTKYQPSDQDVIANRLSDASIRYRSEMQVVRKDDRDRCCTTLPMDANPRGLASDNQT